jgi:excisionase family DNA binding protein
MQVDCSRYSFASASGGTMSKLYTTREVAQILRCTDATIRSKIARKLIAAVKIGSVYRIAENEVNRLLSGEKAVAK